MQIITDRRCLHRIPELEDRLPKTVAYLESSLAPLGCQVFSPMQGSLCAWFDFGKDTAIAFRADCDALPIEEKSGVCFASTHPGCMHACGHDGHMAILLELARRLKEKKHLPHNVLLVFQPSEETTGGAERLCDTGIFEKHAVKAIFALHLWPGLEAGVIASRKNEMMARSCEVTVEISGRSAHIAKAGQGLDALAAGVAFYDRAMALEKALPEDIFRLLKFGHMESGTVRNAISAHTRLEGSLRAFQDGVFEQLQDGLWTIGRQVAEQTGCHVEITLNNGYPAVMNPPALFDKAMACSPFAVLQSPSMTAEDFSFYQKRLPGMLFFLGLGDTPALHAADFAFDDAILLKGADFFEALATAFL